jgi:hypothetical protein
LRRDFKPRSVFSPGMVDADAARVVFLVRVIGVCRHDPLANLLADPPPSGLLPVRSRGRGLPRDFNAPTGRASDLRRLAASIFLVEPLCNRNANQ